MRSSEQTMMEFLVQFEMNIPDGVPESEVEDRERAEAVAAETLAGEGHPVRLWQAPRRHQPHDGPWPLSRRQQGGT